MAACGAGSDRFHQGHRPLLHGLGQHCVVSVVEDLGGDVPGRRPRQPLLIDEQALPFDDCQGRVRVVELQNKVLVHLHHATSKIGLLVPGEDVLHACGDEKVLLLEPELLARVGRVGGIQDRGDIFAFLAGIEGALVVAQLKERHVELQLLGRPRSPQPQIQCVASAMPGDERVVCDGLHQIATLPDGAVLPHPQLTPPSTALLASPARPPITLRRHDGMCEKAGVCLRGPARVLRVSRGKA